MVIKNPTDEVLEFWYSGELMQLAPQQRVRVDDARGNHALSELNRKGLIKLEYGDETSGVEERRSAEGRQANLDFWRKQVVDFNQDQERRLQRKLAINDVPEHIKKAADRLGIKLYEPFTQGDEFTREKSELIGKLAQAEKAVAEKDTAIAMLAQQMKELQAMVQTVIAAKTAPEQFSAPPMPVIDEIGEQELLKQIRGMNRHQLARWMDDEGSRVELYPESIQKEVAIRRERFFGAKQEAAQN